MKRTLGLLLVLTILCSCIFTSALADGPESRASDYFTSYGTSMSAPGGGLIGVTFKAVGTTICNQIGVANYHVQWLNDDGQWVDVSGLLSGQTGSNVASYSFGRYFQGVAGETYRVVVTFCCTINNSSEYKAYTSGRVTAK